MRPFWLVQPQSTTNRDIAMLAHRRDHPLRSWQSGAAYDPAASAPQKRPPAEPLRVDVKPEAPGLVADLWLVPVPLVSDRLAEALARAGVIGLDRYRVELHAPGGAVQRELSAFNLTAKVATLDEADARGLQLFWLDGSLVAFEAAKAAFDTLGGDIAYCHPKTQWP